ncbi:MAG TPA: DUF4349 domain-containing protein [Candidatus Angelobacter sp.]|jgi:hypothetical protein
MNSIERVLPYRSSALWKGVGLGVIGLILLWAVAIPHLLRSRMSARSASMAYFTGSEDVMGSIEGESSVHADGPKVIYKAQLNLLVASCAETQKKIEALAAEESGFIETSSLEENSAHIKMRVPSARFDIVRGKLRTLAIRVRQDSVGTSDVTKQYIDREARLRNLRAEEQQFLEVMKKSHTVPDVLAVTKSLSEVREEIESADAEFRRLKDQIDMAEIEVSLTSQSASGVHWAPGSSTKSAFNDLLQALADLADFLIWLIVNIPLIVLWGVVVFLLAAASWFVLRLSARTMKAIFGKKTVAPMPAKG